MSRIQFSLITSGESHERATHFWTAVFPTQIHHFASREEAMENLARTIRNLLKGNFELREIDLVQGNAESAICGGWRHLVDWLDKKEGKLTTSAVLDREKFVKRKPRKRVFKTRFMKNRRHSRK